MKIPYTIPRLILRAYTHKQTPEQLAAQYEGRVLRSEDVTWDDGLFNIGFVKPLQEQCLTLIIENYPFYVKLTNEWNRLGEIKHTQAREQWEIDLANYLKRKESYDQKKIERDLLLARIGQSAHHSSDSDSSDDDDDDDDFDEYRKLKYLVEPTYVPNEFPDYEPIPEVLDRLTETDRVRVIEELEIEEVPLDIAVKTIPDEYYWERVCNERWPEVEPSDYHGNSWKRMFTEKHVREAIEAFHPFESEWPPLDETIELCASFVIGLTLNNLIPECWGVPRKPVIQPIFEGDEPPPIDGTPWKFTPEDEGFQESTFMNEFRTQEVERKAKKLEDEKRKLLIAKEREAAEEEEEENEFNEQLLLEEQAAEAEAKKPRTNSHLDLTHIIPKLSKLTKLSIVYEMAEISMDWEPRFFDFTMQDCEILAKALSDTPTINHFELNRSRMTGEQTKVLVRDGLLKMPHLLILNLNYNNMGSSGALAIARLITDETSRVRHTLHTLQMARNNIKSKGAKSLAYALTLNEHLTFLDLRLNHIGNTGGKDLGHSLVVNKSLQSLNLAANHIHDPACYVLSKMMHHNCTLKELDLSSNNLGIKGGEAIALAMRVNKTLLKLDVRLANTSLEFEYDIESHLKKNRARVSYNLLEREDIYPPETEGGLMEIGEGEGEDEHEEHEEEEGEGEGEGEGEEDEEEEGDELEPELVTRWKRNSRLEDDNNSDEDDGNVIREPVKKEKKKVSIEVGPTTA